MANEVLSNLSKDELKLIIKQASGFYVGYSDNAVILNSLLLCSSKIMPVNFHLPKIIEDQTLMSFNAFHDVFSGESDRMGVVSPNLCFQPWIEA